MEPASLQPTASINEKCEDGNTTEPTEETCCDTGFCDGIANEPIGEIADKRRSSRMRT